MPEDRQRTIRSLGRAMLGKHRVQSTCRIRQEGGAEAHLRISARPAFGLDGRVSWLHGVCQDITEEATSLRALRDSEDNYRHAVELNPQIPWTADRQGNILEAGPRWAEITGLSCEQAMGGGWLQALHPDDVQRTLAAWNRSLGTGTRVDIEYRLQRPDGTFRWMRATAGARKDASGEIVRWYGMLEDIHDRKVAEEASRQSACFSQSILDNTSECIEIISVEGGILFMNATGGHLVECAPETFVGEDWVRLWPSEHRTAAAAALNAARVGTAGRFTARYPTSSGKERWWDVIVDGISDGDGNITRLLATSRDVTEVKRASAEIDAAHERLSAVLEGTSDYVIVVDREWRVTYMNRHSLRLLAGRLQIGDDLWRAYPEYVGSELYRHYHSAMESDSHIVFEAFLERLDMWAEVRAYRTGDGVSIFLRDITHDREAREEIEHLAHHDPLTGLANRNSFHKRLDLVVADGGSALRRPDLGEPRLRAEDPRLGRDATGARTHGRGRQARTARAQDRRGVSSDVMGKAVSTRLVDIVFPGHTNHHATLFGGIGLAHMDKVAFIAASRHARVAFVTASCDEVGFFAPAHVGDVVDLTGQVTRVGMRSLTVDVALRAEAALSGERRLCGRGRFNMVAVGEGLSALGGALPPLPHRPPVAQDELRMVEIVFPDQTSHYGSLYGGHALAAMGEAAFVAATRHCRRTVVMASTRRVDFTSQIATGEVMEVCPRIGRTGRSSLDVEVGLWAENLRSGSRRRCGTGAFTMVAVDTRHRPPPL